MAIHEYCACLLLQEYYIIKQLYQMFPAEMSVPGEVVHPSSFLLQLPCPGIRAGKMATSLELSHCAIRWVVLLGFQGINLLQEVEISLR